MNDPLAEFREWEGQPLGDDRDDEPGFKTFETQPKLVLHFAGGHVTSTARKDRHQDLHPAVWLRMIVKAIGTERYHIVEGMMDADIAVELAEALADSAARSPLDIASLEES